MKKIILFTMLIMVIGLSSCSDMDTPDLGFIKESPQSELKETKSSDEFVLTFKSQDEFQSALDKIASYETDEEKLQWVKDNYPNFSSIQALYWDAMDEMAEIDGESPDAYEVFQTKYSQLYFPRYLDDAGFYIPMRNLDAAFLVNKNYEVSISGKIVNMRDIESYQDLILLQRAYYSDDIPMTMTRATMGSFNLNSTSMNSVGPEYDSGWTKYGDRKVKLKARRRFKEYEPSPGFKGSISLLHLEFCFRKKTFLGWANYSSKSTIDFKANIPGLSAPITASFSHSGTSSHDSELEYPIAIHNDASHWYYTFVETPCQATVNYQGVSQILKYSWNMPGIQCVTPLTANPAIFKPRL